MKQSDKKRVVKDISYNNFGIKKKVISKEEQSYKVKLFCFW